MRPGDRPKLTARGVGVLVAAGGLLVAAKLFGSPELAGLAAAAAASVGAGAVLVRRAPMTYRADRWLAPAKVCAGDPAHARLRFTNTGTAVTRAAVAVDGMAGEAPPPRSAGGLRVGAADGLNGPVAAATTAGRCGVPPLSPGGMAEARYDLPTGRRGALTVGPLGVGVTDAFGLVERRTEPAGTARLVVHPRIHPVLALPGSPTREARHGNTSPARAPRGDDFFALREYEVGDDLRRVHWRSTARVGDLMLRQDELRFGEVATVLLDSRAASHTTDTFERALEVAASIAAALVEDGRRLRFLTTGGFDTELDSGRAEGRWVTVLEHLALVTPDSGGTERFALALQSIRRDPSGPLAAVVGDVTPAELTAVGALRSRLGLVMVAECSPPGDTSRSAPGAVVVPAALEDDFAAAWNAAVLGHSRREVARR